jgi:hypothetical protein
VGHRDRRRDPELSIREVVPVVVEADEGGGAVLQRRQAGEARPDLPGERVGEDCADQQEGGSEQQVGEPDLAPPAGVRAVVREDSGDDAIP